MDFPNDFAKYHKRRDKGGIIVVGRSVEIENSSLSGRPEWKLSSCIYRLGTESLERQP